MPMIAIIARRPLANSADSFLALVAGSLDVITFHPNSPGLPVELASKVPSTMPAKKAICTQPMAGTLLKAARPLGTSSNFRPREGDK